MSEKLSEITAEATSVGATDRMYIVQGGVSKYIDGDTLNALFNLQNLQSVLEQGGFADSDDGEFYVDINLISKYFEFFITSVNGESTAFFSDAEFYLTYDDSNNLYGFEIKNNGGKLEILQKNNNSGLFNSLFEIEPATVDSHRYKIPSAKSTARTHYIQALSTTSAPSSNTDVGYPGEVRIIGADKYECIAVDTWVKSTVTTTF